MPTFFLNSSQRLNHCPDQANYEDKLAEQHQQGGGATDPTLRSTHQRTAAEHAPAGSFALGHGEHVSDCTADRSKDQQDHRSRHRTTLRVCAFDRQVGSSATWCKARFKQLRESPYRVLGLTRRYRLSPHTFGARTRVPAARARFWKHGGSGFRQ